MPSMTDLKINEGSGPVLERVSELSKKALK